MYLYGASGHAKVIIDILRANNEPIEALFDDNEGIHCLLDYPVLRPSEVRGPLIISIGNNSVRRKIARQLDVEYGRAFHPSAIISEEAMVHEGTVVMQGAIIQSGVQIGRHCIVNTGASVDHECTIEDYVHISPHCTLCGNVEVGEGTWIGAGSTVIPGVRIGKWSIIGAGSVVTKDIPDGVLAVGNRCKIIKQI
jgi:sugar O-acyltransferase (sialic acid O-acetyltransferase NeuD family)